MRVAIIDLGTNTCNLLVAEKDGAGYSILHRSKQLVKLGDDKIGANEISPEATLRTLQSFQKHGEVIRKFDVDTVKVFATSAVRSAENKIGFLEQISEKTGWLVKVITGEKEADLIFKGVLLALQKFDSPSLILDIGGGSNELILSEQREMLWKESRPAGMARVINQFKLSDPIHPDEVVRLQSYFAQQHREAIDRCLELKVSAMVGCSGAFDTIADLIDAVDPGEKQRVKQEIGLNDFYRVFEMLKRSTREERLAMKGMDHVRVDLIVPAVILIEKLITRIGIKEMIQTDFALREGVLYELMHPGR